MHRWNSGFFVAFAFAGAGAIALWLADLSLGLSILVGLLAGFLAMLDRGLEDIHKALTKD